MRRTTCRNNCVSFSLFLVSHTIDRSREAQARRGEEPEIDPDPDNEYGLFAGTAYEADDEEADKINEKVDVAELGSR